MVPEIDIRSFAAAHADGAFVVDVREDSEYADGHVPAAVWIPLRDIPRRAAQLPRGQTIHVICATGNRSIAAAEALRAAGFDAVSVAGGTTAWANAGRPLVRGTRAA